MVFVAFYFHLEQSRSMSLKIVVVVLVVAVVGTLSKNLKIDFVVLNKGGAF